MRRLRTTLGACAAALALALASGSAMAGPIEVLADYQADGRIDADHTVADLQSALSVIAGIADEDALRAAVQEQLDERLLGLADTDPKNDEPDEAGSEAPPPAPVPRAAPDAGGGPPALSLTPEALAREDAVAGGGEGVAGLSAIRELPQPPRVAAGSDIPLAFLALAGAASLLVAAGAGSAAYRRVARSRGGRPGGAAGNGE